MQWYDIAPLFCQNQTRGTHNTEQKKKKKKKKKKEKMKKKQDR